MSYQPFDRNPSGIVFFGTAGSDQMFESNSSFTINSTHLTAPNIKIADGGKIGSASQTGILTLASDGIATFSSGVVIQGNLTVNGTYTTLNTETLTIDDNIIVLNNNEVGSPSQNAGIEVERGTSLNTSIRWNETSDVWEFTNDGTTFSTIGSSGGTVTSVAIAGTDGIDIDSGSPITTAGTITLGLSNVPDTSLATISTASKVSGSAVQLAATSAIENSSGLQIKAATAGNGLAIASQVLSVNVDDSSIEISSDALRVKASGITNAMISGSITANKVLSGVSTKTGSYAILDADTEEVFVVDSTVASYTITLPTAADNSGKKYTIKKKVPEFTVIVDAEGSEQIDGSSNSVTLYVVNEAITVVCNGTAWWII